MRFLIFLMFLGVLTAFGLHYFHVSDAQVFQAIDRSGVRLEQEADQAVKAAEKTWAEARQNLAKKAAGLRPGAEQARKQAKELGSEVSSTLEEQSQALETKAKELKEKAEQTLKQDR